MLNTPNQKSLSHPESELPPYLAYDAKLPYNNPLRIFSYSLVNISISCQISSTRGLNIGTDFNKLFIIKKRFNSKETNQTHNL